VSKRYQNQPIDTPGPGLAALPEQVQVVVGEIAVDLREGLLALGSGRRPQVMLAMMDADV
jgi:hypothetical protein